MTLSRLLLTRRTVGVLWQIEGVADVVYRRIPRWRLWAERRLW